jgi:hypothetical protein
MAYIAITLSMVAVFVSDVYTKLGLAVWSFYLIPLALAYFA